MWTVLKNFEPKGIVVSDSTIPDGVGDEVFEGFGVEFMASDLPLSGPEIAVDVEDTVAEEVGEDGVEPGAFDVVLEVGAEEVVEVGGGGGAYAVGEVEEAVDLDGGGGGEHVGDPVVEAVAVAEEGEEVSDEGVGVGTWGFVFGRWRAVEVVVEEREGGERDEEDGERISFEFHHLDGKRPVRIWQGKTHKFV